MKKLFLISCLSFFIGNLLIAQCNADRHSAKITDQWMSCTQTLNPNIDRGESHWIMYDFGESYVLGASTIWNCNVYEQTNAGVQSYVVDYSSDGLSWEEYGQYNLSQASASTFYEGEAGPNFEGLDARYILITSLSEYGGDCACLSEIRFETSGIISEVAEVSELNIGFSLAPNPASTRVQLSITNDQVGFESEISVLDQTGKLIQKFNQTIDKGESTIDLSTAELSTGNYHIQIQSTEGVLTRKLIVIQDHK